MKTVLERFEAKFIPEPNSGCWLWEGSDDGCDGYGRFRWSSNRCMSAHRAAWCLYKDDIPYGEDVLHRCDNPACVNPDHLFLGDHSDNMRDMVKKGRGNKVRGSHHHQSKLVESEVIQIRNLRKNGAFLRDVAAQFNISKSMVGNICSGKSWNHL